MHFSTEVRWFFAGAVPADVYRWFAHGSPSAPATRTDGYLMMPSAAVGIKRRTAGKNALFEVKAQRGGDEPVQLASGVTGVLNHWVKWSQQDAPTQQWLDHLPTTDLPWLNVTKTRQLRQFSVTHKRVTEVDPEASQDEGVQLELTALAVGHETAWTLGFEAFGTPLLLPSRLFHVAGHLFGASPFPQHLATPLSCAYPTWLASFDSKRPDHLAVSI
ncbi:hypothetical protein SAMN05421823_102213 [Catalinimonas alkaloidigena]|uniref:Uncharacterized protein n=1 Tax=Catalinimonas alkaloidigena TaxID=1075417 RepID=A0A1G9A8S6_9BACT|nr:hypothetical protein [Catalinimonas alkaloidigena]SDK23683.1 hypothetical protein SAMN05421823_102213 [Catalinimonas alkaloidigena]